MAELIGTGAYLFGGITSADGNSENQITNSLYKWNGTSWSLITSTGGPPSKRFNHAMAYDGYNLIMVGGNDNATGLLSDTWALSSANAWSKQTTTAYSSPTTQQRMSLAFVSASGANSILGFGGECSFQRHYVLDTWSWAHGIGWTQLSPTNTPTARADTCMASNGTTTVMATGFDFNGPIANAWGFSGGNWTQLASGPSKRSGASLVYDSTNSKWILFGGVGNQLSGYNNETWTFNGTVWTQANPASPPPARAFHQAAFHNESGKMVMFGGLNPSGVFGDTWIYDASTLNGTWTQQ